MSCTFKKCHELLTPWMTSSKLGTYPIPHQNQKDKIKDFQNDHHHLSWNHQLHITNKYSKYDIIP